MFPIEKGCKVILLSPAGQGGRRGVSRFKGYFFVDRVTDVQDKEGKKRPALKLVDLNGRLLGHHVDFTDVVHVGQYHKHCKQEKGENTK